MTIIQTRSSTTQTSLCKQAAAFDNKIRGLLGIKSKRQLAELTHGGVFYYVITFTKHRHLLIKVTRSGKVSEMFAKGKLDEKLACALYDAHTVLGADLSYQIGNEYIVNFPASPATVSLRDIMDKLRVFLPEDYEASFAYVPYDTGVRALNASPLVVYSPRLRGYLEV